MRQTMYLLELHAEAADVQVVFCEAVALQRLHVPARGVALLALAHPQLLHAVAEVRARKEHLRANDDRWSGGELVRW
jgi:hypothetical protein